MVCLPISCPILLLMQQVFKILFSSFLISTSINMLFCFSRTRSSLSSWISRFTRQMASWIYICSSSRGYIISSLSTSHDVPIMRVIAWGFFSMLQPQLSLSSSKSFPCSSYCAWPYSSIRTLVCASTNQFVLPGKLCSWFCIAFWMLQYGLFVVYVAFPTAVSSSGYQSLV